MNQNPVTIQISGVPVIFFFDVNGLVFKVIFPTLYNPDGSPSSITFDGPRTMNFVMTTVEFILAQNP